MAPYSRIAYLASSSFMLDSFTATVSPVAWSSRTATVPKAPAPNSLFHSYWALNASREVLPIWRVTTGVVVWLAAVDSAAALARASLTGEDRWTESWSTLSAWKLECELRSAGARMGESSMASAVLACSQTAGSQRSTTFLLRPPWAGRKA